MEISNIFMRAKTDWVETDFFDIEDWGRIVSNLKLACSFFGIEINGSETFFKKTRYEAIQDDDKAAIVYVYNTIATGIKLKRLNWIKGRFFFTFEELNLIENLTVEISKYYTFGQGAFFGSGLEFGEMK